MLQKAESYGLTPYKGIMYYILHIVIIAVTVSYWLLAKAENKKHDVLRMKN